MRKNIAFLLHEYYGSVTENVIPFDMQFEFVAIPELIADVERVMYEVIKAYLESVDMRADETPIGTRCTIDATVCGIKLYAEDTLTKDFYTKKKKQDLDIDSLKNDIQYANSIAASIEYESAIEVRKWIYHILNKHFDEPIPEGFEPDKPVESKPA